MIATFNQIPIRIITEQELIIGPIAWDEAGKVSGLIINYQEKTVSFSGDSKDVINRLVDQYKRLFGRASHEVCKEAVVGLISEMSAADVPSSLRA